MHKWCSTFGSPRMLPAVFTIELPAKTPRASFPLVHGSGCITNAIDMVLKTLTPLDAILQRLAQEPRGFMGLSKLTQLVRNHLDQVQ
jgi:hypothetical protein